MEQKDLEKQIRDLLRDPKDYISISNILNRDNKNTYLVEISTTSQTLKYLGFTHTNNPEDTSFKELKSLWKRFLQETNKENAIALVEGAIPPVYSSEHEAIVKQHECGLLTFYASKAGIAVECPEPTRKDELSYLLKEYSKDEIIYYYFVRYLRGYFTIQVDKPDIEEYIASFCKRYPNITGWKDYDFSLNHMKLLHDQKHSHPFDLNDQKCFGEDSSPMKTDIARDSSRFRDIAIVKKILQLWNEGKSIFIVYGRSHAIVEEIALKTLLH